MGCVNMAKLKLRTSRKTAAKKRLSPKQRKLALRRKLLRQVRQGKIVHCPYCKQGRLVENKEKGILFCVLCGKEF